VSSSTSSYLLYIYDACVTIKINCFIGFACAVAPVVKQTTDDQKVTHTGDFDDDIAAEVAAAIATAKSHPMHDQHSGSSGAPSHGGVPDFVPPPVLQKDNDSYLSSYVNNNFLNEDNDVNNWMLGITCAIIIACIVGLTLLIMSALRMIRRSDVFRNYQR
jgi:hypothetical protein